MKFWTFLFRIYDFFTEKKYWAYVAAAACLTLFFVAYRTQATKQEKGSEYAGLYEALDKNESGELFCLYHKNKSLASRIEPYLAQKFLNEANSEGPKLAEQSLKRSGLELPAYSSYARGTILAARKDYRAALGLSQTLKGELKDKSLLSYYNLLRIVILNDSLKDPKSELAALNELEAAFKEGAALEFLAAFKEANGFDLKDYIAFRKTRLK